MKRVVFDIILLVCLFTAPWWVTFILSIVGLFVFKQFYEFMMAWFIMFSIFAIPGTRVISSSFWSSLIIGTIYVGVQFLRGHIILYKNEI